VIPAYKGRDPKQVWPQFFKTQKPGFDLVRRTTSRLHDEKEHEHVIALIEAALIHGQSQPWMYEVLALSMEIAGRPKEDVERVVLSLTDFGQVDFQTMMYSGAYLSRFERHAPALKLYRQASRMLPERPEPYLLGLKLAQKSGNIDDLQWAACGILQQAWDIEYQQQHREAENAALEAGRQLRKAGNESRAQELEQAVAQARLVDFEVRVEWSGSADLDLLVEEPSGTVCSFESRETLAGGRLLHDGCGPAPSNCYELYVCPLAMKGDYRIRVRKSWGDPVGNRAVVKITARGGAAGEMQSTETLVLDGDEAELRFRLEQGRRTQPRILGMGLPQDDLLHALQQVGQSRRPVATTRQGQQAAQEFLESRSPTTRGGRRAGAVAVAPQVTVIPEGTSLTSQAVISDDRRYVRLSVAPVFSNITDVFTFNYLNSGNGASGPTGAGRNP
jgi:hypothetical protein